jgi:hypothetical protein
MEDLEAKVCTVILLSKDHPLTIIVGELFGSALWEKLGPHIIPHRSRIRTLVIMFGIQPDLILGSLGQVPLLQNLHIDQYMEASTTVIDVIQSAESIRSITGRIWFALDIFQAPFLRRLQTVDLVFPAYHYLPSILNLDSLKSVSVDINHASPHFPLQEGRSSLPWTEFRFYRDMNKGIEHILKLASPNLVILDTAVGWRHVSNVLLICNAMPLLQSVQVKVFSDIHLTGSDPDARPVQLLPLDLHPSLIDELGVEVLADIEDGRAKANVEFYSQI